MSKGLSYFLGIVTGILLTLGFVVLAAYLSEQGGEAGTAAEKQAKLPDGVTMLDEPVPFNEARNFEILQVVSEDAALAQSEKKMRYNTGTSYYSDPVVLIISDQKNTFYDNQVIKAPKGCKVMQVGTYNYRSQMGWKTVPVIRFIMAQ